MPLGPEEMVQAITKNLPAKTGKTIDEWVKVVKAAGTFGPERVTHRIGLASPVDVDDEVMKWLRAAYDKAAK